jgi:Secretion system C-terminal sorting domain
MYRNDAYRLAYKRIVDLNLTYKDSINIPLPMVDSVLKAMAMVHNMPASSLRDTLVDIFNGTNPAEYYYANQEDAVHVHGGIPSLKKIIVSVAVGTPFANDWISGNYTSTADAQINTIMSTYGLTAQLTGTFSGRHLFWVKAVKNYNPVALKNLFPGITGVYAPGTSVFPLAGDGCMIDYSRTATETVLSYRFACGDCPAGCTGFRRWNFRIPDTGCGLEYLGTSSSATDVIPPYNFSCEILIPVGGYGTAPTGNQHCTAGAFIIAALPPGGTNGPRIYNYDFTLSPNPASTTLKLDLPRNLDKQKTITVSDLSGKRLKLISHNERTRSLLLDISPLMPGAYTLTIQTPYSLNTLRFIKN